jgi:hypothetical protein
MPALPTPSFDLTRFDLTRLDLTRLDMGRVETALTGAAADTVTKVARDAAYVAIGFGVLAIQGVQLRRRAVEKTVAAWLRNVTG